MPRVAFADESGTDANPKCYAIGVVSVAAKHVGAFNRVFVHLKAQHGVASELRWKNVDRGHGLINLTIDWLSRILRSHTARFDAIVVNTEQYRKWSKRGADREGAFYLTYTQLLRHIAKVAADTTEVFIDDRSDSYDKQNEVVQTIGNHMLNRLESSGRLQSVTKVPSHLYPGIQVADLITGAIAASHRLHLDPDAPLNAGKRLAISRLSQVLGWDALHYDTYPHSKFNIWHFPSEYRADPATRQVKPARMLPYIVPADLGLPSKVPERNSA
jgi:hypothetical protein